MIEFVLLTPEEVEEMQSQSQELPDDYYEDTCEECGGRQWVTGGQSYYNGSYSCYRMELTCENCGPYDVECV